MFSQRSEKAIEAFSANPPSAPLTVIEVPSDELAVSAATTIAKSLLGEDFANDFRNVAPQGAAWTVEEITHEVCAPANLAPNKRNVIVIVGADRMAPSAADKLLKTVEEPGADTLFFACCVNRESLPSTILSRVSDYLELATPPVEDVIEELVTQFPELDSEISSCGPLVDTDPGLLVLGCENPELLSNLSQALNINLMNPSSEEIAEVSEIVETAASLVEAPTPAAAKRRVCDAVLGAWAYQIAQICYGNPTRIRTAERVLDNTEEARRMIARGAKTFHAFFTALS